jgi:hypothetical protein
MSEEAVIQGEPEGTSLSPVVQEEQIEAKARQKGWKPLEEYKGSPEDWVSAKEYVGRQKLYDRIDELKGEVGRQTSKFQRDLNTISAHFEKQREADYVKAKQAAKEELRLARREGDTEALEAAETKLDQLEEDRQKQVQAAAVAAAASRQQQAQGPTPEFTKWQEENGWFQSNREMQQEAIAIGTGYAALHPTLPQNKVLEHVSNRIKKLYPEEFEGETQRPSTKRSGPSTVESGDGGRNTVSTKKAGKGLTVADLDAEQREVMRVLIKRGALKSRAGKNKISQEEQYLRDIEEYENAEGSRKARR